MESTCNWTLKAKFQNSGVALRNVIILKKEPRFALSGDLLGDLKVWDLEEGIFKYNVPEHSGLEHAWFRSSGAVVALSQNLDFASAAFSNICVVLYSLESCDTSMTPCLVINLAELTGE